MTHLNPTVLLIWTLSTGLLGLFLVTHLYAFDRFNCLRWNQGSQGAFKRAMTYSYITSIPLLFIYSLGYTIIKYQEGLVDIPPHGVLAKPYELWSASNRHAILPLNLCFSVAWALEIVSHLEELCFWMYVVNSGPMQREWFNSQYFKAWVSGSVLALIYMPLLAILTRKNPLQNEATIFLAGALGSCVVTIAFFPVLYKFPGFLRNLRHDGVDMATVVRLTKFHELNKIRIFFRFVHNSAMIILASDGIAPHKHINEDMFATDFLALCAAIGILISSGITLTIFFPRNIEHEINRDMSQNRGIFSVGGGGSRHLTFISQEQEMYGTYIAPDAKRSEGLAEAYDDVEDLPNPPLAPNRGPQHSSHLHVTSASSFGGVSRPEPAVSPGPQAQWQSFKLEPNRRAPKDDEESLGDGYANLKSTPSHFGPQRAREVQLQQPPPPRRGRMAHFVQSFRSPIDFRRQE